MTELKLSDCQSKALVVLAPLFEEESKSRVGILTGSAGTGKTYLTAYLINELESEGWNVKVLAPTGRAAQVLADKMKPFGLESIPQTIHSCIYKIEPLDYSSSQLSIFGTVSSHSDSEKTIFIIDEGSMVGDEKKEQTTSGFNFGSGSLLHDIFEFADLGNRDDSRVLIVGDPCQLPPVSKSESTSPALSLDKIKSSLPELIKDSEVLCAELDFVHRQGKGTLLDFVNTVRSAINSGEELPKKAVEDVRNLRECDLVGTFLMATDRGDRPEGAVILAHTNKAVFRYNQIIRQALDRGHDVINEGEILLVKRNVRFRDHGELNISNESSALKNGTFIQVTKLPTPLKDKVVQLKGGETITLKFHSTCIRMLGEKKEFYVTVLSNALFNQGQTTSSDSRNKNYQNIETAILIDFQRRMKAKFGWNPPKPNASYYEEYDKEARTDKYMNALRVNYGYAVTVHNSQGGEWPVVIVDPASNYQRDLQHFEDKRVSFARWIYTASTRASKKLYFLKDKLL
ncbi:MAG: hypothetical protein COA49_05890 [Bacteroidetes bacterium]|nr:MAG: hypothetical protein COA49_05890 [Bacteroidota bacterium]